MVEWKTLSQHNPKDPKLMWYAAVTNPVCGAVKKRYSDRDTVQEIVEVVAGDDNCGVCRLVLWRRDGAEQKQCG